MSDIAPVPKFYAQNFRGFFLMFRGYNRHIELYLTQYASSQWHHVAVYVFISLLFAKLPHVTFSKGVINC